MSDTRLPWRDSRDNLQRHRYAASEQGDVTSNPVRIHGGDSRKDGPGNPRNLVVASGENSFIRTTRRPRRLLSRYCSMYNNLGAAHSDGHGPPPLVLSVGNLIPLAAAAAAAGGKEKRGKVSRTRFTRGIALCGGSSRWRRPGDRKRASGEGGGGYRQKDLHGGSTASQIT